MSPAVEQTVVYVLTGLAAVVVVLTRLRLGRSRQGAGRHEVGRSLLTLHTLAGVLAVASWVSFLVAPDDSALGGSTGGIVALGLWWVVSVLGILVLLRWLPSRGKHAAEGRSDSWSDGPGLSVLAHVGMLVGVGVFTWAYLQQWV